MIPTTRQPISREAKKYRGLVAHWPVDNDGLDYSGNKNNVSFSSQLTKATLKTGTKLVFNGSTQYANCPVSPFSSIAIGAIVIRVTPIANSRMCLFSCGNTTGFNNLSIEWGSVTNAFSYYFYNSNDITKSYNADSPSNFPAGNEYLIALTVDATGNLLHVDGIRQSMTFTEGNATRNSFLSAFFGGLTVMHIGNRLTSFGNQLYANAAIEILLFNRILGSSEMLSLAMLKDNPARLTFIIKLLALADCISTPTADSLALQPCNLLSLGLTQSTPIADAVALTETLSLLLDTAESTPTASPLALANATALICLDAVSTPTSDALTLAHAVLLVIENAVSMPVAMPLTLSGQIALTLSQAISTPVADDIIIRTDLALQIEQSISMGRADSLALQPWQTLTVPDAVSTPRALSLALTDILIGLGKLFKTQVAVATPLHSLASATPIHSIRKVDG